MFELPGSAVHLVLAALFVLAAIIQLWYYLGYYIRTATYRAGKIKSHKPPVSVVICARNEAGNLKAFLPSVMEQDYPDFEVVVVNDCSEDDSEDVLKAFEKEYSNLKIVTIHKESSVRHSKKMALFIGIKSASHETLVLTDADCQPVSGNWIKRSISSFRKETDFVLGYGGYLQNKGLLNKYIRMDTMFLAMQYLGMARAGIPYMGVGRNLGYRKSVFFENRGFGPHLNLQSGDDDLFVNALARKKNTAVCISDDAFTRSVPATTWRGFTKQKKRHMSTATLYRGFTKFILLTEPVSRVAFYSLFAVLLSLSVMTVPVLALFAVVFIVKNVITSLVRKTLNEKDLLLFSPLYDIISPFLNVYFMISVLFKRHLYYEWK